MSLNKQMFDVTTAYIVLTFVCSAAIVLLLLLIHLIIVTKRKLSSKKQSLIALKQSNRQLRISLIATIFGIFCFEFAILLIIGVIVQLILIDAHKLHLKVDEIDRIYYESFDELEYLIAIFDSLGHITVIYLFINRFEFCFKDSHFQHSTTLIRILYTILVALLVFATFILVLIIMNGSPQIILTFEVVWECVIEIMCLWLLYLFIAKLYELLTLTYSKSNLFRDLTKSLSANYKRKKERSKSSNSGSKDSKKKRKAQLQKADRLGTSKMTMTIDGVPTPPPPKRAPSPSPNPGSPRNKNASKNDEEKPAQSDVEVYEHTEHEPETTMTQYTRTNFNKRNSMTGQLEYDPNLQEEPDYTESNDLVNVMNKLTVLVVGVVLSSIISIIGNIFIELHEMETIHKHTADIAQMWAFLLPVFDMMCTALMLYLQFTFTHHVYVKLLGKLDMWLMKLVLKVIRDYWRKEKMKEEEMKNGGKQQKKKPTRQPRRKKREQHIVEMLDTRTSTEKTKGSDATPAGDSTIIVEEQEVP